MLYVITVFTDLINISPFNGYIKIFKPFSDFLHIDSSFPLTLPFDITIRVLSRNNTLFYQYFIGSGWAKFGELVLKKQYNPSEEITCT